MNPSTVPRGVSRPSASGGGGAGAEGAGGLPGRGWARTCTHPRTAATNQQAIENRILPIVLGLFRFSSLVRFPNLPPQYGHRSRYDVIKTAVSHRRCLSPRKDVLGRLERSV